MTGSGGRTGAFRRRGAPAKGVKADEIDFDHPGTLVRLALVTRLDSLRDGDGAPIMRGQIARDLGLDYRKLSDQLSAGELKEPRSDEFVQLVQCYLHVAEGMPDEAAGAELAAFRKQILGRSPSAAFGLRVPSTFFRRLAASPPRTLEDTLLAGASLLEIREASTPALIANVWAASKNRADPILDQLVAASCLPHDEQRVTMTITSRLRQWALPTIERHLQVSPVAHRSVRLLTRMLRSLPLERENEERRQLWPEIERVLQASRSPDMDPGRGFVEEALRYTPGWDKRSLSRPPTKSTWACDWIPEALKRVAADPGESVRRRSFAALCFIEGDHQPARGEAQALLESMRTTHDVTGGLEYAAESIGNLMMRGRLPWEGTVAAAQLSGYVDVVTGAVRGESAFDALPGTTREAAVHVTLQALLSPDITRRRVACDTLSAAGAAQEAGLFIGRVVVDQDCPEFLREVGAVVLGYLGHPQAVPALCALATGSLRATDTRRAAIMALGEVRGDEQGAATGVLASALRAGDGMDDVALYAAACRARQDSLKDRSDARPEAISELAAHAATLAAQTPDDRLATIATWTVRQISSGSRILSFLEAVDPGGELAPRVAAGGVARSSGGISAAGGTERSTE